MVFYYIKIKAYRFFNTELGKSILKLLAIFVYVPGIKKRTLKNKNRFFKSSKKDFIIAITIDTESGYVKENDYRLWQASNPRAYIGFYKGIENWRILLNKYKAKATFFLSPNCFSANGEEYKKIIAQLKLLIKEGHEIGLHLHPDSDLALQSAIGKCFQATSAKFYTEKDIDELIYTGKTLIKKHLGINTESFRWGNFALNTDAVKSLQKNGFKIDSSAAPSIKGHQNDKMTHDWSKVDKHYTWKLSNLDYQNTVHQNSDVTEIPVSTFNFLGLRLRADPANSSLLLSCFDYYYKNADRSKKPFIFVVISHSSEATQEDGSITKVIKAMEEFLQHSKKFNNVKFLVLKESYNLIR